MTRVLYLDGEPNSYFAESMQKQYSKKELVEMTEESPTKGSLFINGIITIGSMRILDFGEIDPMFVNFLYQNDLLLDDDLSKHRDFIILD